MELPHRIAAGAIVVRSNQILLVRYRDPGGGTYVAAPGGGVREHESVAGRRCPRDFEEAGLRAEPGRVLLIEDVLTARFKMCKVWLACRVVAGDLRATEGARFEGIIEAPWFRRTELDSEQV
jgi:ADP-ribose pyrophosphatase YjhB (NUDIX family)